MVISKYFCTLSYRYSNFIKKHIRCVTSVNNRLCVEDLITQTKLSSAQAKDCLEGLAQKGVCEIRLNEVQNSGKIYYYFD